ncbi:hypothetical protein FBD94_24810 [Pedobacter hiemivivus]|uniref:Uncharacterized protein n=1 Tax=Pedobacter hiemivivus TaxID=2530454 RepID=A0A4U1G425_9SPHI|nr:hypothetical protein [Pedobacter hiemivivus]TKC55582.1 hypothetical protein FBD94_24810 [Pedobacter hiemivivus]
MTKFLKTGLFMLAFAATIASCKKEKLSDIGEGSIKAETYTFNKATKSFDLGDEVKSEIDATNGIKLIYSYLIRNNATDSLIYITTDIKNNPKNYTLTIPLASFPANNMSQVKGVKIMVKQSNNSSLEGFIPIKFFDPDLPQFNSFPTQINADLNGATAIAGNLTSDYGIKQVDIFDDFQTENTYVLAHSINTINGAKQYALNYAYTYRKAAQHIKIRVTDIYNQTNELIINMPVDVAVFKPKFIGFAAKITPITAGTTPLTGNITSVTGLKKIDIYDDRNGVYELVSTLSNLNGVKTYNLNTTYLYKKRASNLKLIAVDTEDLQTELIIPLNVNYGSVVYRDVFMTAQTLGTNTVFLENGTTAGNCNLIANEANIQFVFFAPSAGPTLYNPFSGTTGTFPANMKCNGTGWTIADPAALKDTKFRVLINGASTGQTDVYNLIAANEIDDLSDAFFTSRTLSAPSSSGPRYEASAAPSASLFNLTTAKIIYLRITNRTTTAYKNAIMVIKEVNSSAGNSTMKFDIYIQK